MIGAGQRIGTAQVAAKNQGVRNMHRVCRIACITSLLVLASTALAQSQKRDTSGFEQKVIRLDYIEARETARMLQGFLSEGRVAADERTNTVVISAPHAELEMATRLISELLDSAPPQKSVESTAIIHVGPPAPDDLMELVHTVLSGRTRASYDRTSGLLVLRGDEQDIAEVRRLVDAIPRDGSTPNGPTSLTVSFYFIQGLMSAEDAPKLSAPQGPAPDKPDTRDESALAKLQKPVELNAERAPFVDVLNQLSRSADLDIVVNWSDLEGLGVDREQLVSITLRKPVELRQALELLFEQLGSELGLAYEVRDGILRIASRGYLDRDVTVEVYDVNEFVKAVPRFALQSMYASEAVAPRAGGQAGGFGGGVGGQPAGAPIGARSAPPAPPYVAPIMWDERDEGPAERFMELIQTTVTPDDWHDSGGDIATLQHSAGMLVVKHNARGHRAIAELLDLLRQRHAASRAAVSRVEAPAMLAPVMGALADNGFQQAVLLAPLKVTVGRRGSFAVEGSAAQFDRMLGVRVEGDARMVDATSVELKVQAMLGPKVALPGTLGGPEPMFRLTSVVSAPLGDYIVLATSPGATDYGQAIALVVRVDAVK